MDTFSLAALPHRCTHNEGMSGECSNLTRIRIENVPYCEDHMHQALKANARARQAIRAKTEHERRRAERRNKTDRRVS